MAYVQESAQHGVARINITPLVDVLLVLLVIFMIAAPVLSHTIELDLPGKVPPSGVAPSPIALRIDSAGALYWNDNPAPLPALPAMLQAEVQRNPGHRAMLQIDASGDADYGVVAKVLADVRNAGIQDIGFVRR